MAYNNNQCGYVDFGFYIPALIMIITTRVILSIFILFYQQRSSRNP